MSCLNCCMELLDLKKSTKVTFNNSVKVIYFKQTPIENDVCWMQVARDRARFKRRILDVEQRIGWIFKRKHRERVYKTLYIKDS